MTVQDSQRLRIAELSGWVWYRLPRKDPERNYRFLALPLIQEYEGQSDIWKVRADGTERVAAIGFMERDCHLPNYHKNANDCLDLCEMLALQGWNTELNNSTDTTWECNFRKGAEQHYGAGRTMMLAVVEAFLQMHGKWTAEDDQDRSHEYEE